MTKECLSTSYPQSLPALDKLIIHTRQQKRKIQQKHIIIVVGVSKITHEIIYAGFLRDILSG